MIPLYHDFAGETVLVFGGGRVGARKARRFAAEAEVIVVSPDFADDDFGGAERVRDAPAPDGVEEWVARTDPALVVAATDDEAVNEAAERAARGRGALVNRADESGGREAGSVVVPATATDGDVTAAISTGGASPALAKYLRERVESELDGAGAIADLTADLRTELKRDGYAPEKRREAVRAVVRSPSVWKALRTGESNPRQEADRVIRNTMGGDR
ncbi:precorrin-2 dehydrogenase/sirohydrochlorin ferrochelatase family protein [Halopelagius longus]|uniref:precorrin-2 dehydrogenase n=1 Tax=Halopelagius longus TaxID=1236180 RepID=A0A1H0Y8D7_9EURY|nr:bifunctional precorrin-2 dehydrogenase/sirohydrochlorin ferrochelatase [Halopelagius longus]RDI72339.1 bifunctional precorrin-2 dehydrogenase/sirohydrochlorin ferrochelatase [Halopelagius longus]SDQ11417.1 precorrin-2 dehydrogenase / sirohydrochlorin ferrochelatase [Halopelagius longus]